MYVYSEKSQKDVIKEYSVDKLEIKAKYVPSERKSLVLYKGEHLSVEDFVIKKFEEEGYSALKTESIPFHALYAVFMSHVIIDPSDEHLTFVGFSDKNLLEQGVKGQEAALWCYHPEDFGTQSYWERRKQVITNYINELPTTQVDLISHFDFMLNLSGSYNLRNYLWAHKEIDAERARTILGILSPSKIKEILIHLNKDYWGHYLGWPDLLIYRNDSYCFVEVKSSKDKLSEDQKTWIARNYNELKLPFKLVKVAKEIDKD